MKKIFWVEDEAARKEGIVPSTEKELVKLASRKNWELHRPVFDSLYDFTDYLCTLGEHSLSDHCVLLDVMFPNSDYVTLPGEWANDGKTRHYEAELGMRAGLVFFERVLLQRFSPPPGVIYLTSVHDHYNRELYWIKELWRSASEQVTENSEPRVGWVAKGEVAKDNASKVIEILTTWDSN